MHTTYRLVYCMLLGTLLTCQTIKRLLNIVHQRLIIKVAIVLATKVFQSLKLLYVAHSYVWRKIEIEGRYSLTTMHLILCTLHRDTCQNRCCLYAFCRTTCSMPSDKSTVQDIIKRMLNASERLSRIIVLIVYMQIIMLDSLTALLTKKIVINERLGCLRGKLHHHSCWSIGIHVGILASNIIILDVYYIEEHLTSLCLTGHRALMTISYIFLSHILTARLHQLYLYGILNLFHTHLTVATLCDMIGYLV